MVRNAVIKCPLPEGRRFAGVLQTLVGAVAAVVAAVAHVRAENAAPVVAAEMARAARRSTARRRLV